MAASVRRAKSGRFVMLAWFVLVFVADFRFEQRSVLASVEGVASPRVVVEFGAFSLAGWLAFTYLVRLRWLNGRSVGLDLFLAYGLLAAASALWSEAPLFSFVRGAQLVFVAFVAKASAGLWIGGVRDLELDWRRFWLAFVGFIAALGVSGFIVPNYQEGRFAWQGMHAGTVGGFLGVAVVMVTFFLIGGPSLARWQRVFLVLTGAWCLWLLILTITRSTLAATAVSLLSLVGLHAYRGGPSRRAAALLAVLLVMGTLWWFSPAIAAYALRGQSLENFASLTGRTELWNYALGLISDAPVLGHGYGSGRVLLTQAFPWGGTGHNLWVEVGLGLGIVGVAIVTGLLVWILRQAWLMVRVRMSPIALSGFAVCVLITVKSIASESFSVPGSELAMIGLIAAALTAERRVLSSPPASIAATGTGPRQPV
jgi:O-antigen ligase